MGRKATFNDPARQIVQTSEDQHKYDTPTFRRLQVNANVTNQYITPNTKADASALTLAFAEAAPSLALLSQNLAKSSGEDAYAQGQAKAIEEMGLPDDEKKAFSWFTHPRFKDGYDSVGGFTSGTEAKAKMEADYESDPNRNNMTTQEWVGQWMQNNKPKGVSGAYVESWNKQVLPAVGSIIKQGATDKAAEGLALVNQKITDAFQATIKNGWNAESADKLKLTIQGDGKDNPGLGGMNNADWDRNVIKQVEQFINAGGEPEKAQAVLAWTRTDRKDGDKTIPGIYSKPGMAKIIDDLSDKANTVWLNKKSIEERLDVEGRNGNQTAIFDSAERQAVGGNLAAATKTLKQAYANGEISFKGFLRKQQELQQVTHALKLGDGTGGSKMAQKDFDNTYADALEGKLSTNDITVMLRNQRISKAQADQLLGAEGRAASSENALYRSPEYKRASSYISGFAEYKGITDDETNTYKMRGAVARAEFAEWAANNPDKKDQWADKAKAIVATETKFIKDRGVTSENVMQKNYYPKYPNPQAAYQAIMVDKTEKDPYVLRNEQDYWKWRSSAPQTTRK